MSALLLHMQRHTCCCIAADGSLRHRNVTVFTYTSFGQRKSKVNSAPRQFKCVSILGMYLVTLRWCKSDCLLVCDSNQCSNHVDAPAAAHESLACSGTPRLQLSLCTIHIQTCLGVNHILECLCDTHDRISTACTSSPAWMSSWKDLAVQST